MLRAARREIQATLGGAAGAVTEFQAFFLPQQERAVQNALNEFETGATRALNGAAGQSWQAGQDLVDEPIAAGGVRIAAVLPEIDTRQLVAMRTFMTGRIKDISVTVANRINSELGLIAIGAQTPGEAVGKIEGLVEGGRARAITITRTELGRAFSVANQERLEQARESLPGLKKQWRKSGKLHSRAHHDAIDGQVREVEERFVLGNGVPIRFPRDPRAPAAETINCGCEQLPFMETWEVSDPGVPITDPDLRTRQAA
ncbi:MAG: hypothetical protein ACYSTY_13660 [Planctomycetota bacterium]